MGIKNVQNGAKNLPKWTPNGVPDGPVGGQDGSKIEKNRRALDQFWQDQKSDFLL